MNSKHPDYYMSGVVHSNQGKLAFKTLKFNWCEGNVESVCAPTCNVLHGMFNRLLISSFFLHNIHRHVLQGVSLTHPCIGSTACSCCFNSKPLRSININATFRIVLPVTSYCHLHLSLEDSLKEEREHIGAAFLKHVFSKEQKSSSAQIEEFDRPEAPATNCECEFACFPRQSSWKGLCVSLLFDLTTGYWDST